MFKSLGAGMWQFSSGKIPSARTTCAAAALLALSFAWSAQQATAQTMSLPGSFAVSGTGAATYKIPITVPPGTAGVSPSLSLEYNSQGAGSNELLGGGLVGVGWSLGGLPSIGRCAKTFVQDGVRGAVNFDANDRFCMEGQRLVAISGTYGADGSEYRSEVDIFSKIISRGTAGNGPAWFEVRTKTGQIMEFGHTADSQILAQGKTTARSWALSKLSDTKGNYFTVTYVNDATNGQAYPTEINYTGNATTGLAPYNKVQFVYVTRPDITPTYHGGSLTNTTVRLTNVKTYAGAALVADYRLAYQQSPSTLRSEVTSVTLCAGDGSCLPATAINWSTGTSGTFAQQQNTLSPVWNFGVPPEALFSSVVGDFNNDGKTDYMLFRNQYRYVLLSNGNGTFTQTQSSAPWDFGEPPSSKYLVISGDFNGDGKTDYLLTEYKRDNSYPGDMYQYVFLGNGDGTFTPSQNVVPSFGDLYYFAFDSAQMQQNDAMLVNQFFPIVGDFNGDGRADYMLTSGRYQFVFTSNGDGTFSTRANVAPVSWDIPLGTPSAPTAFHLAGDFNGDGKTDYVIIENANQYVSLSNGDGSFTYVLASTPNWDFLSPPYYYSPVVGDFNGDGRGDYVMLSNQYQYVFLGTGSGDFTLVENTGSVNFGQPPSNQYFSLAGDINGDGKSDFMLAASEGQYVFLANGPVSDMVQSISNGIGATTSITYQPLTNSSVYSKDSNAAYPVQDLQAAAYVVSRIDKSNGIGGTYAATYSYAGAKVDMSGRGFLGFRQTAATDPQTGVVETTNYLQAFPYIGMVGSTTKKAGAQTLSQATSSFDFRNVANVASVSVPSATSAPYRISSSQNIENRWDLDGTAMPTVTTTQQFDAYGNATQVSVAMQDGYSKTTNNSYNNNATTWIIGRLTRSSVTSVAP